jgi:nifR3 family TIM-barrel protein
MSFRWKSDQPLFCLAPMEGATDAAFRQVVVDCGKPDVMFTEFVNVSGMMSVGRRQVAQALQFEENEQPLIAQIWGLNPDHFYAATKEVVARGFAGVDINMGCPDKAVIKKGAGGALIKNRPLVSEIIQAVKLGAAGKIPVSVKIRIGFDKIVTDDWAAFVLSHDIDALTVHGRTVAELSKVPCHWDEIGKVVSLRNQMNKETVIIGNGDVFSRQQGLDLIGEHQVQGVMIGRGIFHNPWIFSHSTEVSRDKSERIALLLFHLDTYERLWGATKPFAPLKKYFKIYIQSFDGASELRERLMETKTIAEARALLLSC